MEQVRVWLARLAAPLAFLAAATVLVVVIQRALDDSPAANPDPAAAADPSTDSEGLPPAGTGDDVPEEEREFYRIEQGDTLEGIAAEFETTVDTLLALNPDVDQLTLQIGQRIRVK